MYPIFLSQVTSAEDAGAQILQTAVPELVMRFPGAWPTLCRRGDTGGGQMCWLRVRSCDCSPKHASPDLPWLVRLTRGLRTGCCWPSEVRGAGLAGLETLGSHRWSSRPSGLPRRVWRGQPRSLQPGEALPGVG